MSLETVTESLRQQGYVVPAEAAKLANVSIATIYHWVKDGRLGQPKRHGLRRMFVSVTALRRVAGDGAAT